ncbi:hypothetical protein [Streptomyces sp. NPDC127066]|uniref:tetratricopeptide repeat protein n=1 Tax=Streptomyces sp. NPDC127066 TaxID=3347125 RepID=UPI003647E0B8
MLTRPNFAEWVSAPVRSDKDGLLWICGTQGGHVEGDDDGRKAAALAELRARLKDAIALSGLTMDQLVGRMTTSRGGAVRRSTLFEALRPGAPVPTARTVAAIAGGLALPQEQTQELLDLQRAAVGKPVPAPATTSGRGLGKPIAEWDPHDLEVHAAGTGPAGLERALPGYVPRAHDRLLADAAREAAGGRSRMLVLVGSSSTGKTRACWEAVQPLAEDGWRLWHPFDPTRAEAALADLEHITPRTVVWLNEAQHYLDAPQTGERIAAALHTLLTDSARAPVLVLGTLWPQYANQYMKLPSAGSDPHSRVRELLAARTLTVPDTFDRHALATAQAFAGSGDRLLADALTRAGDHGRLAQDLAGAPELLRRYADASPAVRALLQVAMDARRLGAGPHLPHAFLVDAAADYLDEHDWDELTDDWAEAAFADLARRTHGRQAPLRRSNLKPARHLPGQPVLTAKAEAPKTAAAGPVFVLADYLDQHGRTTRRALCPPASFWHAAYTCLIRPDDLNELADAAKCRHRLRWAHDLRHRAAEMGSPSAWAKLALMQEREGDREGAEDLARQAAAAGDTSALSELAETHESMGDREGAEGLARQAAAAGDTSALLSIAKRRVWREDLEGAEALLQQAVATGDASALAELGRLREESGDLEGAEALYRRAAAGGDTGVLTYLALAREKAGDREGAETFALQGSAAGNIGAVISLAAMREGSQSFVGGEVGGVISMETRDGPRDQEGADTVYRRAADAGNTSALLWLAQRRERAFRWAEAKALTQQAVDAGAFGAMAQLTDMRERLGDRQGAEALARQAAATGDASALTTLVQMRERRDRECAEALAQQAADAGHTSALAELGRLREESGDLGGAEALYRQAVDKGDTSVLYSLAGIREDAGDLEGAKALMRQVVDAAEFFAARPILWWPHGLEPDGSPTAPWTPRTRFEISKTRPGSLL